jgi:4a-hydroxytetrahydrobiopterin dehydratase
MARPTKLAESAIDTWLTAHPGWSLGVGAVSLRRSFVFRDFSGALAFAVQVGLLAEKRDHHPDIEVGWGKASVTWTTHDAGGITSLDLDLAAGTESLVQLRSHQ